MSARSHFGLAALALASAAGASAYGTKIVDDVLAAVDWVRRSGEIDAARIGIIGSGPDGDLALLAASRQGQAFKCVVADSPRGDLEKFADKIIKVSPLGVQEEWKFLFGDVGGKRTREQSPLTHAATLSGRSLVTYLQDGIAGNYVERLQKLGKPLTAIELRSPAATKPRGIDRLEVPKQTLEFLRAWL